MKIVIEDDNGVPHEIIAPDSFYVPHCPSRLLSPQHWAQKAKDNYPKRHGTWCATYDDEIVLEWNQRQYRRTITLDQKGSNTAWIHTAPGYSRYHVFSAEAHENIDDFDESLAYQSTMVTDDELESESDDEDIDDNDDSVSNDDTARRDPLTTDFRMDGPKDAPSPTIIIDEEDTMPQEASALFLRWHHRLGHVSPKKIRLLANLGLLPKLLATCRFPLCTSCLFGKATRRPWRGKTDTKQAPSKVITEPGQCVSVDQLESTTPGLIAQLKGIPTTKRYKAATVFVDHYSRLSYVHLQKTTSASETIEAKESFERFARAHGVTVTHYHADNGRFADNKFREAVAMKHQTLSFCGVNAHFQNGVAERRIRELQDLARTMLIHANRRWPQAIDAHLWPYAIRMANDAFNSTPDLTRKLTPIEAFSGSTIAINPKHFYHFGCPVYVLSNAMQAGQKIDKWKERARVGIYLGTSPQHARTVALVLSLTTGLASPQFHVRMDSTFQTMRHSFGEQLPRSLWQEKCHFIKPTSDSEGGRRRVTISDSTTSPTETQADNDEPQLETNLPQESHLLSDPITGPGPEPNQQPQSIPDTVNETAEGATVRRSTRQRKVPQRLIEIFAAEVTDTNQHYVAYEVLAQPDDIEPEIDYQHPAVAFAASNNPDIMYWHEAMRQSDRKQFIQAAKEEIDGQTRNGNWRIIPKDKVPEGATILPAVWAMRRKRRISTGEIYRWKARLNLDGSKQIKGIHYWETYAPVASWPTIRMILTMAIIKGWKTKQIDFVQAYTQAKIETDNVYMKIPKGFEIRDAKSDEYVLKIDRNIYGGKAAGRVWNKHLVNKLTEIGFKQSEIDHCLFYRGQAVYVLYTDDSILAGPDEAELDHIVEDMQKVGLKLSVDGDVSDFLGVKIHHESDGTIHLTQPQIIDSILRDLHLTSDNVKTRQTPAAVTTILRRHPNSEAFDEHFNYRSVIGKLNFLEKSTRPDISCATHQCARFAANPKQEHGKAVEWLCRYLAATRDKGIILRPTEQSFDVYVDADYVGNWDPETASDDIDTARSRTGYIVFYAGCPIIWKSKLQTQIALSTTEAEFMALSAALRETIPLMELVKELQRHGYDFTATQPTVHCRVFEDNSGAIELARVPKMRPRTKFINVQYHHFRQYVDRNEISILSISTEDQCADILTKSVSLTTLIKLRLRIMGW
jgi:hypothetical protein